VETWTATGVDTTRLLRSVREHCGGWLAFIALRGPERSFTITSVPEPGVDNPWSFQSLSELAASAWDDPRLRHGEIVVRGAEAPDGVWPGRSGPPTFAAAPLLAVGHPDGLCGLLCIAKTADSPFTTEQLTNLAAMADELALHLCQAETEDLATNAAIVSEEVPAQAPSQQEAPAAPIEEAVVALEGQSATPAAVHAPAVAQAPAATTHRVVVHHAPAVATHAVERDLAAAASPVPSPSAAPSASGPQSPSASGSQSPSASDSQSPSASGSQSTPAGPSVSGPQAPSAAASGSQGEAEAVTQVVQPDASSPRPSERDQPASPDRVPRVSVPSANTAAAPPSADAPVAPTESELTSLPPPEVPAGGESAEGSDTSSAAAASATPAPSPVRSPGSQSGSRGGGGDSWLLSLVDSDPLTQLAGPLTFLSRIGATLSVTDASEFEVVVVLVDLAPVTEAIGPPSDALLLAIAAQLRGQMRPNDVIGRVGPMTFSVLAVVPLGVLGASAIAYRLAEAIDAVASSVEPGWRTRSSFATADPNVDAEELFRKAVVRLES